MSLRTPFIRCASALAEWVAHTLLSIGIILCIAGTEWCMRAFLHNKQPLLFGTLPLAWIFHGAELGVLVGVSYYGVRAAVSAYRGQP